MNKYDEAIKAVAERYGKDTFLSLITMDNNRPSVRFVDSYYEDASFYVVTNALSNKMQQIKSNPEVTVCVERFLEDGCFTAHGIGENIGHVLDESNVVLMAKLREAFAIWYTNGHVNENDPNTCILRIRLTNGTLLLPNFGNKYVIDFVNQMA